MKNLYLAAQRLIASILIAVFSRFDRGLDGLLGTFNRLDAKLEAFIDRQNAIMDHNDGRIGESYARQAAFDTREQELRQAARDRSAGAYTEACRAHDVRARLNKLLGK
ncbi:hypothetical protein QQS45_08345 [Alteriqipengyuania flavescens]|uniref:hypothetical protein n=1 Tax=Alteriqipengyuania flavescens TaxID=3053610 RepID=UPI0025B4BDCB|nr:hypothetical protein [Alteriqipengyuania flavescens]WJY17656.1 hypothetical protein QQW98_08340 [Alteriqipengyuania flavescens]WJY23599.1 hypothetical protein QQS45_08345 [Alteriqipengyuania flavescens]